MYQMNEKERAEREEIKALHLEIRKDIKNTTDSWEHRYLLLAWGYLRGFKFRRIERNHRVQRLPSGVLFEHNMPSETVLRSTLLRYIPALASSIHAWLADPTGAIPAPPPRPKKVFVRVVEESAHAYEPAAE